MTARRRVMAAVLSFSAAATRAQAPRQARIVVLGGSADAEDPGTRRNIIEPLRDGLHERGRGDDRIPAIQWRFADGRPERLPRVAGRSAGGVARRGGDDRGQRHAGPRVDAHSAARLATVRAIRVEIPRALRLRADEVIE